MAEQSKQAALTEDIEASIRKNFEKLKESRIKYREFLASIGRGSDATEPPTAPPPAPTEPRRSGPFILESLTPQGSPAPSPTKSTSEENHVAKKRKVQEQSEDVLFCSPNSIIDAAHINRDRRSTQSSTPANAGERSISNTSSRRTSIHSLPSSTSPTSPTSPGQKSAPFQTTDGAARTTLFKMGRISKKPRLSTSGETKVAAGPSTATASNVATAAPNAAPAVRDQPEWYKCANINSKIQGNRPLLTKLQRRGGVNELLMECKRRGRLQPDDPIFDLLRKEIHDLEFIPVTAEVLRRAQMMHNRSGLPQIFDKDFSHGVNYPWDIKSDAEELYNKWFQKMFVPDIFRGINLPKAGSKHKTLSLSEPAIPSNYFGDGFLKNGQWWGNQLCALRDGAHGSAQAGIYGVKGEGACSVVLSGSHYEDRDEGDQIWYCGTDGKDFQVSESTQLMIDSCNSSKTKYPKPVRVMRSSKLPATNPYRPARGFRYDGLYTVLSHEVIDKKQAKYLFHMKRVRDQDPIRRQGTTARPTEQEIAEFEKVRRFIGLGVHGERDE